MMGTGPSEPIMTQGRHDAAPSGLLPASDVLQHAGCRRCRGGPGAQQDVLQGIGHLRHIALAGPRIQVLPLGAGEFPVLSAGAYLSVTDILVLRQPLRHIVSDKKSRRSGWTTSQ